jgi:hypothetical protein
MCHLFRTSTAHMHYICEAHRFEIVFYGYETYCVYEFRVNITIMWCECDNYVNLYYICDDYVNMKNYI